MKLSIQVLEDLLTSAERNVAYYRYMEASFRKNAKPKGVLTDIANMHARDAAAAEARAADYRAGLAALKAAS